VEICAYGDRIEFLPARKAAELRGFLGDRRRRELDRSESQVTQFRGESASMQTSAVMLGGRVVDLTTSVALEAARLSLREMRSLADSIILATARHLGVVASRAVGMLVCASADSAN
jgi:predicted nucleic acid-binding protein